MSAPFDATPILLQRAPRFVYVVGEARTPNQYLRQFALGKKD